MPRERPFRSLESLLSLKYFCDYSLASVPVVGEIKKFNLLLRNRDHIEEDGNIIGSLGYPGQLDFFDIAVDPLE